MFYAQLKQAEKSVADYTKAIEYGAGADAYFDRAFQYHMLGKFEKALSDYKTSFSKGGARRADALVYVNEADVLYKLRRFKEAVADCDKAIEATPTIATARLNRAQDYFQLKRYQAAIDDIDAALNSPIPEYGNPDLRRDALWLRALAYQALGNSDEATTDLDDAKEAAVVRHRKRKKAKAAEIEFPQVAERKFFVLCSSLPTKQKNEEVAERIEALFNFLNANIAHVKQNRKLHIFIFQNSTQYDTFMSGKNGIKESGLDLEHNAALMKIQRCHWDSPSDSILSCTSDAGALISPIVQKVLTDCPFIEKWAPQGIASLLTKSYGYASRSDCQLYLSQNIRIYGTPNLEVPPLLETINNSRQQPDDPMPMLAAAYLFRKGKLQTYLELCKTGEIGHFQSVFEAAMGKPVSSLESDWKSFVQESCKQPPKGETLPSPQLFAGKELFDSFREKNPQLQLLEILGGSGLSPKNSAESSDDESEEVEQKSDENQKSDYNQKPAAQQKAD